MFLTSARTGAGLVELEADIVAVLGADRAGGSLTDREPYFLRRWVEEEWGRVGLTHLDGPLGGAPAYLDRTGGFDHAQQGFGSELIASLRGAG